jgi:hypothetical protein
MFDLSHNLNEIESTTGMTWREIYEDMWSSIDMQLCGSILTVERRKELIERKNAIATKLEQS